MFYAMVVTVAPVAFWDSLYRRFISDGVQCGRSSGGWRHHIIGVIGYLLSLWGSSFFGVMGCDLFKAAWVSWVTFGMECGLETGRS